MQLLSDAELTLIFSALAQQPADLQRSAMLELLTPDKTTQDKDVERKRRTRSEAARIEIPACKNQVRRKQCLADPERFLRTYFHEKYRLAFGRHHHFMIDSIVSIAKKGGRQAVAAPRGCGKSEVCKGLLVYVVLAGLCRFPMVVAATTPLAHRLYADFKSKIANNDLLLEDFPEVCFPVRALEGAPARANKQHVDGTLTRIKWTDEYIQLPYVPGSSYGGCKLAYAGLDAAFRGCNIDGDRPDFVLVDDPETRESAKHRGQAEDREQILDRDIAGLKGQDSTLAMVALSTVQNDYCLSARLTDRAIKPAWNGVRFGMIDKWPSNMDLWEEYIAIRRAEQTAGDTYAHKAVEYYLANQAAMELDAAMLSEHFNPLADAEGKPMVFSALQQAFNQIADTSIEDYKTEYQNDPEPQEMAESVGITAGLVASRVSGYLQRQMPDLCEKVVVGFDMGKMASHWVKVAFWGNAIGTIVDYGVAETWGLSNASDNAAIEKAQLAMLHNFRSEIQAESPADAIFVDAGTFTQTVYSFVRQVGTPWFATKGWDRKRFTMPKQATDKLPFLETYAAFQQNEALWLYHVHTEWWKDWVHQRFVTPTFNESHQFNDGSLSLYSAPHDKKRHTSFSHHIVAEGKRTLFVEGKGNVTTWETFSKNNHWLDALALACAAAGCLGIRLLPRVTEVPKTSTKPPDRPKFTTPDGKPFLITER